MFLQQVRWFQVKTVVLQSGRTLQQPEEPFCWLCGISCECWPLEEKAQVCNNYWNAAGFRREFKRVRAGVQAAEKAYAVELAHVKNTSCIGLRISQRVAFLTETAFKVAFKMSVETYNEHQATAGAKLRLEQIMGPHKVMLTGVVMSEKDLPPNTEWFLVEQYYYSDRSLERESLTPKLIFRQSQPQERFQLACTNAVASRPASLNSTSLPSANVILAEKRRIDRILEGQLQAGLMNTQAAVGENVTVSTSSKLQDADEFLVTPVKRPRVQGQDAQHSKPKRPLREAPMRRGQTLGRQTAGRRISASSVGVQSCSKQSVARGTDASIVLSLEGDNEDELDIVAILCGSQVGRELRKVC